MSPRILMEIRPRPLAGGLLSFIPGVFALWDRLRPMGECRPPEYGRNVWRARLEDARNAGEDISPQTVMELGPGRSLSAPIAALLDGTGRAIGMDAVAYASASENLRVFDALVKEAGVDERRAAELRRAVAAAGDPDRETVLQYRAPWSDESTVPSETVDFIFSVSVLEHVTDSNAVYRSCFRWLRPGGVMAHKIDHSSHGITRHWNGHYWISDWLWRLILGRRPYAINRWTPDDHRAAAKAAGFEVVSVECGVANDDGSALYRQEPQGRFRNVSRQSLFAKTSIFVMRKPEVQVRGVTEDRPLVTIGITAYNAAETIERAIRSALAQTWRPIEIVVVDDCSSDKTPALLEASSASHPELRVFRNESNGGVAAARNRIVAEAKGEFIVFFDDDDESLPERVKAQLRRIRDYERNFADGAAVICHTVRRQRFPDGSECLIPTMGLREGRLAPSGWAVAERALLGSPLEDAYGACATCSQMARTSTYRALGGFDADFRRSEDSDLVLRLAKAGGHFVGVGQPLVVQNMTKSMDKSLAGEKKYLLMLLDKHRDVADRAGLYDFCRRWIDIKQAWLEGRKAAFIGGLVGLALRHPLQTARRLALAVPNIGLNRAFGRFHTRAGG